MHNLINSHNNNKKLKWMQKNPINQFFKLYNQKEIFCKKIFNK